MNTTKTQVISAEVKLAIAVQAIKTPTTNAALSAQFGVSETSVRRAIKAFHEAAQEKIAAEEKAKQDKKVVKTKRVKVESAAPAGPRGYKGRNGRWTILNKLFDEKGLVASAELYLEANKRSAEAGLTPLNKNSFYAMVGIAKRLRKGAAEKVAEVAEEILNEEQ